MSNYAEEIRLRRNRLGLTQTELSQLAHISLLTVQNIESGQSNPCWQVLSAVCHVLGLKIQLSPEPADWNFLCQAGVPLQDRSSRAVEHISLVDLRKQLGLAAEEIASGSSADAERKKTALQSFLLALKLHFPTFFHRRIAKVPGLLSLVPKRADGKIIKLCRIAHERQAHYL